ncbi:MAG: hypothetical protein JWO38_6165 [Gemmataceae bacterium]|nr:hypothetical protein [Gemmataceae bacterium]
MTAPDILKGIGQERQAVKCAGGVDIVPQSKNSRSEPGWVGGHRLEWVAEDVPQQPGLSLLFSLRITKPFDDGADSEFGNFRDRISDIGIESEVSCPA